MRFFFVLSRAHLHKSLSIKFFLEGKIKQKGLSDHVMDERIKFETFTIITRLSQQCDF